ncbi:MAG: 4-(cytidine 5'-diphospho)-2-C-methyl-D-erythritol kinase [Prolixibacteraceae bacterium]
MILFPNAKINLGLDVLRKRNDGFHDIETVFYPIQLSDVLEINLSEKFAFSQSGISIDGEAENNLVVKAYRLLKNEFNLLPVQIHLHKIIPFGAGLGGGSSDAAFALKGLNQLFHLNLTNKQLEGFASLLGSDCPFFIQNKPIFAEGKGNEFTHTSISLEGYHLALIKPNVHVPTAVAYSNITPVAPVVSLMQRLSKGKENWRNNVVNSFESSVFQFYPEVQSIKETLYEMRALYASMSGSGSSVYGIFNEKPRQIPLALTNYFSWMEELK